MAKTIYVDGSISDQRSPVTTSTGMGKGTAAEPYENIFQIAASELDAGGNNVINIAGDIYINPQTVGSETIFDFLLDGASGNQNILQQWASKPKARLIQAYCVDNNPDFQWIERTNGEFSLHPAGAGQERGYANIKWQDTSSVNGHFRTRSDSVSAKFSAERMMAGSKADDERSKIGSLNELDIGASQTVQFNASGINTGTDVITSTVDHGLTVGDAIRFKNKGGTPFQVDSVVVEFDQQFFVKTVPSSTTFTISATLGGSTANITNAGAGDQSFGMSDMPHETIFFKPESGKTPDDYEILIGTGRTSSGGGEVPSYFKQIKDYWTIKDITFLHGSESNLQIYQANGNIIENCNFVYAQSRGIDIENSASDTITIRNCIFSNHLSSLLIRQSHLVQTVTVHNNVFHSGNGAIQMSAPDITPSSSTCSTDTLTVVVPDGHGIIAGKKVQVFGYANGSSSGTVINGIRTVASVTDSGGAGNDTIAITISGLTSSDDGSANGTRTIRAGSNVAFTFVNNLCVQQQGFIKSQYIPFGNGTFTETNNYFYCPAASRISHTDGNFNQTNNNTNATSYPATFDTTTNLAASTSPSKFRSGLVLTNTPNPVVKLNANNFYDCDFHPTPESLLINGGTHQSNTINQGADKEGVYWGTYPNIGVYQTSSDGNPNGMARLKSTRVGGFTLPKDTAATLIPATVSEEQSRVFKIKPFEKVEVQCSRRLKKGEFVVASNGAIAVGEGKQVGSIKNVTGEKINLFVTKSVSSTPVAVTYS